MVDAAVSNVKAQFGRIEVLVNNADVTQDARLQKSDARAVRPGDRRQPARRFSLCASRCRHHGGARPGRDSERQSVVGIYGNFGQTNYAASKFGVIGFTKTWNRELGPKGVRVYAVAPGFITTPILVIIPGNVLCDMEARVPLGRLGQPEEIANVYAARQVTSPDTMVVTPPFMVESIQPIWFCLGVQSPNTNTK